MRRRPCRHYRTIKTRKGRKRILVNKGIKRRIRKRNYGSNDEEMLNKMKKLFDTEETKMLKEQGTTPMLRHTKLLGITKQFGKHSGILADKLAKQKFNRPLVSLTPSQIATLKPSFKQQQQQIRELEKEKIERDRRLQLEEDSFKRSQAIAKERYYTDQLKKELSPERKEEIRFYQQGALFSENKDQQDYWKEKLSEATAITPEDYKDYIRAYQQQREDIDRKLGIMSSGYTLPPKKPTFMQKIFPTKQRKYGISGRR